MENRMNLRISGPLVLTNSLVLRDGTVVNKAADLRGPAGTSRCAVRAAH